MNTDKGYIYAIKNKGMYYCENGKYLPLIKIGQTKQDDVHVRMRQLSSPSGVPFPFECIVAVKVDISRLDTIEKALHSAFGDNRVNKNREFFAVDESQVYPIISAFGEDATDIIQGELEQNTLSEVDEKDNKSSRKRPVFDFLKLGMNIGDTLYYKNDASVTCTIADARRVIYKDESRYLSAITSDLLGYVAAPTPFWKTKSGATLYDIYLQKYK